MVERVKEGKVTGKIKKRRGKGDSICAWEMNVEDEEKAKGERCVYVCGGRD